MDKSELIRRIYERKKASATMKDLSLIVDEIFAVIRESLEKGEKVDISDFGCFDLKDTAIKPLARLARKDGRKKPKT